MSSDADRDLRRLAKQHGIFFANYTSQDKWPSRHRVTFGHIKSLGRHTYQDYCPSVDIHSHEQPWKEQRKHRAAWIARRSRELFEQQRNEAGWRFGLENKILDRFSVEVACLNCRARIWRSEIEAATAGSLGESDSLRERQRRRRPCECPPDSRPQDYSDLGINPLFDDRVQEVVLHKLGSKLHLPKQEPDRVFGLRQTQNIERLLSAPMPDLNGEKNDASLGDFLKPSPFKDESEPLVYPFLILEAKSEKSSSGYADIQTQTLFPILSLLKLQDELSTQVIERGNNYFAPLVWFLGYRGDGWRVYGCYEEEDSPKQYKVLHLWDGCITNEDGALQLLLIMDYIFDWARDVYRPSILKQLKSLAAHVSYDEVSLVSDHDIASLRNGIDREMGRSRRSMSLVDTPAILRGSSETLENIRNLGRKTDQWGPCVGSPRKPVGAVRPANVIRTCATGLYLNKEVTLFLGIYGGRIIKRASFVQSQARVLIKFLSQWDELIFMTRRDLSDILHRWIGPPNAVTEDEELGEVDAIFTMLEFATYLDPNWNIVRELRYLAVSKESLDVLLEQANYAKGYAGLAKMADSARLCSNDILLDAIDCLRSGSSAQTLYSAITCVSCALFCLPKRQFRMPNLPAETVGFGPLRHSRLTEVIADFRSIEDEIAYKTNVVNLRGKLDGILRRRDKNMPHIDLKMSLVGLMEGFDDNSGESPHSQKSCQRCGHFKDTGIETAQIRGSREVNFSDDGFILAEAFFNGSSDSDESKMFVHRFCIFAKDPVSVSDKEVLAAKTEAAVKANLVYHTLQHPIKAQALASCRNIYWYDNIWNLPCPLRDVTPRQKLEIAAWVSILRGEDPGGRFPRCDGSIVWAHLQLSLRWMKAGVDWRTADAWANRFMLSEPPKIKEEQEDGNKDEDNRILVATPNETRDDDGEKFEIKQNHVTLYRQVREWEAREREVWERQVEGRQEYRDSRTRFPVDEDERWNYHGSKFAQCSKGDIIRGPPELDDQAYGSAGVRNGSAGVTNLLWRGVKTQVDFDPREYMRSPKNKKFQNSS